MAIRGTTAPLEGTIESAETGLISTPIEPAKIQDFFATEGALTPLLDAIEAKVKEHLPDLSTKEGREAVRSLAFKVTKSKTYLASLKKGLTTELKALPTRIDRNWSAYETRLEDLQALARKPLTDWEEAEELKEKARLQAIQDAAAAAQLLVDHEFGLLLNEKFDRDRAEAKRIADEKKKREEEEAEQRRKDEEAAAEIRRLEDEARIRKEAEERAAAEAQALIDKAAADQLAAEQRAKDAEAESLRLQEEAKARAEADLLAEAQRVIDEGNRRIEEQARIDAAAAEATRKEQERQAAEKKKLDDEEAARASDREHRAGVNREALSDIQDAIFKALGQTALDIYPIAKAVTEAIVKKEVRHVTLSY
jgi:phage-related minor tail protein